MVIPLKEQDTDSLSATRESLLARLANSQDEEGWREFFESYWRLIYNVARKSGLGDSDAQEVVQNTFLYLARRMPRFHYDRKRGRFKSWLRVVTRSRISEFIRREKGGQAGLRDPVLSAEGTYSDELERIPDESADALDQVWQAEWESNLVETALNRIRARVTSHQLLIFQTANVSGLPASQVARKLGISVAQVYVVRHRVGKLFKAEIQRLRKEIG